MAKVSFENIDVQIFAKMAPLLNHETLDDISMKIIQGELEGTLLHVLVPYLDPSKYSLIEAAVLEGQLDADVLDLLQSEKENMDLKKGAPF